MSALPDSSYLLTVVAFVTLVLNGPKCAGQGDFSLTPDDREIHRWLDTLSFPRFDDAPYVRIESGQEFTAEETRTIYTAGFKIAESKESIEVFGLDLHLHVRTGNGSVEEVSLPDAARQRLDALKMANRRFDRMGARTSERVECVILAKACAKQGHEGLDARLMHAARNMPQPAESGANSLRQQLAHDIAHTLMWRAVEAFGNASVSRQKLLLDFQHIIKHFPDSAHIDRARETADLLSVMIIEDAAHVTPRVTDGAELPIELQVAELIFQLRNQNSHQRSQPGSCNILDPLFDKDSPAVQLRDLGFHAIPQLIDAIESDRFTRSVEFHRDFYFSHHVLRVGDCARTILEELSGRSFYGARELEAPESKLNAYRENALSWWVEVKAKGEKQWLIESTLTADNRSLTAATSLVQKYPDIAFDTIRQAIQRTTHHWIRTELVDIATKDMNEAAFELLTDEMLNAPTLPSRLHAAISLHNAIHPDIRGAR